MEPVRDYMFNTNPEGESESKQEALYELREIDEIRKASQQCVQKGVAEPAWNTEVHSRLFRQALKGCTSVEHENMYV